MSDRITIRCERCNAVADVSPIVDRFVRSGRRPAGWRPKRCPACVLALIEGFDVDDVHLTEQEPTP